MASYTDYVGFPAYIPTQSVWIDPQRLELLANNSGMGRLIRSPQPFTPLPMEGPQPVGVPAQPSPAPYQGTPEAQQSLWNLLGPLPNAPQTMPQPGQPMPQPSGPVSQTPTPFNAFDVVQPPQALPPDPLSMRPIDIVGRELFGPNVDMGFFDRGLVRSMMDPTQGGQLGSTLLQVQEQRRAHNLQLFGNVLKHDNADVLLEELAKNPDYEFAPQARAMGKAIQRENLSMAGAVLQQFPEEDQARFWEGKMPYSEFRVRAKMGLRALELQQEAQVKDYHLQNALKKAPDQWSLFERHIVKEAQAKLEKDQEETRKTRSQADILANLPSVTPEIPSGTGVEKVVYDPVTKTRSISTGQKTPMMSLNTVETASEEAAKQFMRSTRETYDKLKHVPSLITNIEKAKQLIPKARGFMGPGGEALLGAAKFLKNRLDIDINVEGIKSAEELRSRIFFNIMENLKKMDAQPSQMQQMIMMDALGKLGTDPDALNNILDAYRDTLIEKVQLHNAEVAGAKVTFPYNPTIKIPTVSRSGLTPAEQAELQALEAWAAQRGKQPNGN